MDDLFFEQIRHGPDERFRGFGHLMPFRVQEILLVSSLYDAFTLEEGGRLTELLLNEYRELNLSFSPHVTRVGTGAEALRLSEVRRFDMVLAMSRLGDMDVFFLARELKKIDPELPVFTLAFNPRELTRLQERNGSRTIDRFFLWSGDVRLLLAIIKSCEDLRNVHHDTSNGGVRTILLIEDSVRFFSSYLPMLYTEVVEQTLSLMQEGLNLSHKLLRLRARPKILLATDFEEAWLYFSAYKDYLLGVISDGSFPWNGDVHPDAGLEFIRRVKQVDPHTPAVLQSSDYDLADAAAELGAGFIPKDSPRLLDHLHEFMLENFGFGDFVFRLPDGREVGRAEDLRGLVEQLRFIPDESILRHAAHDHFSTWLRARTEFPLATRLRSRKVNDFGDAGEIREYLIESVERFRIEAQRGIVTDFSPRLFDRSSGFVRIGGGSLGGKARGLAFMNSVLDRYGVDDRVEGVSIQVPPTAVLGTDVFDAFLDGNDLRQRMLGDMTDGRIVELFLGTAKLPAGIYDDLRAFLDEVRYPLAVRSSSLLEDSQFQPFAGVYSTYMLANNHPDLDVRLDQLCDAIKLVYASTFYRRARSYLEATGNRLEEEKMAVIIQQLVGEEYDGVFYPHLAGVAHSTNFYPAGPMRAEDGVAVVALGMGRTVVEGGKCLHFCPALPDILPQFDSPGDWLACSQREFWAIDVRHPEAYPTAEDFNLLKLDLATAERHGTLAAVGSVYSPESDRIHDGLDHEGVRLVTFAQVLKANVFPLTKILRGLLELGRRTMSSPVEIEFAVSLSADPHRPHRFGLLQIRPLAGDIAEPDVPPELFDSRHAFISTAVALGNGRTSDICDVVYIPRERFDRDRTRQMAAELGELDGELARDGISYLLLGAGRLGSSDPWLGVPVRWDQIAAARVVVETDLDDFKVTPSQGSHFFQNLTSFRVGYLTINSADARSRIDWEWLDAQPAVREAEFLRHVRLSSPLTVLIDGRRSRAVVLKPDTTLVLAGPGSVPRGRGAG
ncbi:MAG: PEP/pyruvate-binding domain-containing protein [Candidatus Krumholzibacteriia bacterium]